MNWKIYGILISLLVVIGDQLSKWFVTTRFLADVGQPMVAFSEWLVQKGEQAIFVSKQITSFLNIVMVWNPGVSFGLMQTNQHYVFYGLTLMAVIVSCGFLVWLWRDPSAVRGITIGLIVGGALGNVFDRIRFGAVIDFIDIHVAGHHWPAFNVADSAISIGVVILLIETLFFSHNKPEEHPHE